MGCSSSTKRIRSRPGSDRILCDPSGEGPDGLQLLALLHSRIEQQAFGDIDLDGDVVDGPACRIAHRGDGGFFREEGAVLISCWPAVRSRSPPA